MKKKVLVAGATGLVGGIMTGILEERSFPVEQLIPVASERSAGKTIRFGNRFVPILGFQEALALKPDIALFSAGKEVSRIWAPRLAETGCRVIDNSSCWRMDPAIRLVVPEINGHLLTPQDRIIANPNCSTIQMVMALAPLHRHYGLRRIVVSTYQSVTGSGRKGMEQLFAEKNAGRQDQPSPVPLSVYPRPIEMNVIPQIGAFLENGYTEEEMKMVQETQKILDDPGIRVSATTVRVPVKGGHSLSVNASFKKPFVMEEVYSLLASFPGLEVTGTGDTHNFITPLEAEGRDPVYVSRIRRDLSMGNTLDMWIVADNLRKGAALNAVQIAEKLLSF
ncbi:MAG TPA: aspartate-semialdehyde dehydrogenase [Bacteroidales bacterium]|nr:aspartate-semialdehyde dehydrogenase [Bacteroidales bacterium]HRW94644.1 aspartate-semialdehyde dehydrogenase [Bacteroidales bacterium]